MSLSPVTQMPPAPEPPKAGCMPLTPTERRLCLGGWLALTAWLAAVLWGAQALAALGWPPELHGHPFADTRSMWGIPHFWDVFSNLPFLLAGVWGWWSLKRPRPQPIHTATWRALQVFFLGLMLTSMGSAFYHWAPDAHSLVVDRLGMAVAFAGVLGLAMAERVGAQTARNTLMAVLVLAVLSAVMPLTHGNPLPWLVVQLGGMGLLAWTAARRPLPMALGVSLASVLVLYALAKCLEMGDAAIYDLTAGGVAGHSLKHVLAAMAALPVIRALRQNAHTANRPSAR